MARAIRDVEDLVAALREDGGDVGTVDGHLCLPPREARFAPYPDWVLPRLKDALQARGITSLYVHQRAAADHLHARRDVVVATATASGKSVCYHLPVLDALLRAPSRARALYLFPTKALSRDQMAELETLLAHASGDGERLTVAVYDGDTPPETRRAMREGGHLVITNPYMLHAGILPNHTKWQGLFSGLEYVVVDEVHTLSGVYGSHVANVLRRLRRICAHYGSNPTFCAASATISNAAEHARRLFERPVTLIDDDGSARGPKHFLFLNPQLLSEASGARVPALDAARRLGAELVGANGGETPLQSIWFVRSRSNVEVLLKYLRDECKARHVDPERVTGYRGGYLPNLRREIERGLRDGRVTGVVSTNALELGIDIGSLDVCVLVGYPGTVSSTFQRAGRVGRRQRSSAVILIARAFAMDQFLVREPGFLFDAPREAVSIDPDNAVILANHVKCAAFELPFTRGDGFGDARGVDDVLDFLAQDLGLLVREGDRYHFAAPTFPAEGVSLSAADLDNVVIHDRDTGTVLAEIDRASAITEVYEGAIYGHLGEQYLVEEFRYDDRRCYVRKADVDYYTEADTETEVRVLHVDASTEFASYHAHLCEVHVSTLAKAYKKLRFYTRENVGDGEIDLPPEEFETEACVLALDPELAARAGLSEGANGGGLRGLAELIQGLVPLFVRVDPGDVRVSSELRHPHFERPTIVIHDAIPNGVGLSERIFRVHEEILDAARGVLERCRCRSGCPACIGPARDQGLRGKQLAQRILAEMRGGPRA